MPEPKIVPADKKPLETQATEPGAAMRARLGLAPAKPKEAEEEIVDDKKKPDAKPDAKPAAKKPTKAAPRATPIAAVPAIDTEALAEATTRGFKKAMTDQAKRDEPKATDGMTDDEKENHRVLVRMGEINPARKGIAENYSKAVTKLKKYQSDWESKNQGKAFDLDADEHAEFVAANDVKWADREFNTALADIIADERVEKRLKPLNEKLEAREAEEQRQKKAQSEQGVVIRHQRVSAKAMFNHLGEDFEKILDDNGVINQEELKRLQAKGPVYVKMLECANNTEAVCAELKRIELNHSVIDEKSFASNPIHREILSFADEQEAELMKLPEDQRINQHDQSFVTSTDWGKMTPAQRKSHWTFNVDDLSALYASMQAKRAKAMLAEAEGFAEGIIKSRGYVKPEGEKAAPVSKQAPVDKNGERADNAGEDERPARSPVATFAPKLAPIKKDANGSAPSLLNRLTGRR